MIRHLSIQFVLLVVMAAPSAWSAEAIQEPPNVPGFILIHSGDDVPRDAVEAFIKLSGGPNASIIVLSATTVPENQTTQHALDLLKKYGATVVRSRNVASVKAASDDVLLAEIKNAGGVWIAGTKDANEVTVFSGTPVEAELRALLNRKGALLGTANWVATFVPNSIIELHPGANADRTDFLKRLAAKPEFVGYAFDEGATLFFNHRNIVVGDKTVSFCIPANATRPARIDSLTPGAHADLVALIRSARVRLRPPFPPEKCPPSELEGGTLVIDGGGIPKDVLPRFIQAAGGPDALILVIPTAQGDDPPMNPGEGKMLKNAGAKNLKTFHLKTYAEAFDDEKIKIIKEAKGIWFCGGRQWRYVDAYLDTPAEKLMHDLLKRGGAIGGSSAGATIIGDYLVRGNPLGNVQMMSEGYERGLGFLKGVAIDQHFMKRNRFADMTSLKKTFPQLLGFGIDEGAAVVVTGHTLEVIGNKSAYIYDKNGPPKIGEPDFVEITPGGKYDLRERVKK
ncbi:MAG: Type 1 glutamine amidotransferase-like domain-containing protein [Planctomycetota bacterium]